MFHLKKTPDRISIKFTLFQGQDDFSADLKSS